MWVGWVLKGVYDPERLERLLKSTIARNGQEVHREIHGVPVYGDRWDPHIALVDEHTLAIVIGDVEDQGQVAEPLLRALTAESNDELAPAVQDALAQFERQNVRIGAGGRMFLSPDLLAEGRRELQQEVGRHANDQDGDLDDKLELAAIRMARAMLELESARGYMTNDGKVTITADAGDNVDATAMAVALNGMNDVFVDTAKKLTEGAPEAMREMFGQMQEGPIEATAQNGSVTLKTELPTLMEHITMLVYSEMSRHMGAARRHQGAAVEVQPVPAP
jgi:hypothetical protein